MLLRPWVPSCVSTLRGWKRIVSGAPPGTDWQALKDHFAQCGPVAFACVGKGDKGKAGERSVHRSSMFIHRSVLRETAP